MPTIDREALKVKIDRRDRFTPVETLSPASSLRGHLPGAVNLPPDHIADMAATLLPDKSAEVIIYCSSPT